ncbi:MAG: metallophosphoesterase [Anaerolineae bacterium]|nr:metallophosphoesterase [Anaerolineae bacterium]
MRILAISDLYYSLENRPYLENLASQIKRKVPDVLIIAGGLGEPLASFEAALSLFDDISCHKAMVLGNRDVWARDGEHTSQQLWSEILPGVVRRHGFLYLEDENMVVGRVGICGTIGWYDYSGRDTRLGYTVEQYQELKGLVNHDAQYIDWSWSDQEFAATIQGDFAARLEALDRDRNIERIVVVTHFPVFKDAVLHLPDDAQWNFGAAYAFNLTLGRIVAPKMKVRGVISGHLDVGGQWDFTFGHNVVKTHIIERTEQGPALVVLDI